MIDLDKILALEAKATPGPWALVVESAPLTLYLNDNFVQAESKEDIDLISAMRNSIKELCAELKAAREVVDAARLAERAISSPRPDHDITLHIELNNCKAFLQSALQKLDEARQG